MLLSISVVCALRTHRRSRDAVEGRTVHGHCHVEVVYAEVNYSWFVSACCGNKYHCKKN